MTDDDDANDPQLRSLRAIWLAMPDEEPPERGLAELMAAARVKAEEMAKPSLWDRILAMFRRPAVLALATVMVLIGGAVLIGNKRSKMEAEPTIAPTTPGPQQEVAPASGSAAPVTTTPVPAEEMPEPSAGAPALAEPPAPPLAPVKRPRPSPPKTTAPGGVDTNKYKDEGDAIRNAEETSLELRDDRAEGGKVPAPEQPLSSDGFAAGQTKGATTATPTPPSERARQYVQQAKTALKKNNCEGAKRAMTAARKLDQAVWADAQKDQGLASCLSAPVAE